MSSDGERDETEQRLLAEIRADPYGDEPRMAYRDLLLERGDPRGELLASDTGDQTMRVTALWATYGERWLAELPRWARDPEFDRGMVYSVRFDGTIEDYTGVVAELIRMAPVPVVVLTRAGGRARPTETVNVHTRPDGRVAAVLCTGYLSLEHQIEICELPSLRVLATVRYPTSDSEREFRIVAAGPGNRVRFARDRDMLLYDLVRGPADALGEFRGDRRWYELEFTFD